MYNATHFTLPLGGRGAVEGPTRRLPLFHFHGLMHYSRHVNAMPARAPATRGTWRAKVASTRREAPSRALEHWRDTLLVLNFRLHDTNRVGSFTAQGDKHACER